MPWGKKRVGDKVCVYKKDGGTILHCYTGSNADSQASKYLAVLYMHADPEAVGKEVGPGLFVTKQKDGGYWITAVSTAAVKDLTNETFSTQAMDYEIKMAKATGEYPEFRMFHKPYLGIGKVEKMRRVGIFAVDEGPSYTDPFSLAACEKMLGNNQDGKWKISRGFYALEVSGDCPHCGSGLLVKKDHMQIGFRCPSCQSVYATYKGALDDIRFLKTRTFDVTITDIPCVPYTGVSVTQIVPIDTEVLMNKAQLKEKLLAGGMSAEVIDERLSKVSDEQLKQYDDLPDAALLKEFQLEEDVPAEEEIQTFVLDDSVLKQFSDIVDARVKEALEGLTLDIDTDNALNLKEQPEFKQLMTMVTELKEMVTKLTKGVDGQVADALEAAPRNAGLRVLHFKTVKKVLADQDDEEGDDDLLPVKNKEDFNPADGAVLGLDGKVVAKSMTEFLMSR